MFSSNAVLLHIRKPLTSCSFLGILSAVPPKVFVIGSHNNQHLNNLLSPVSSISPDKVLFASYRSFSVCVSGLKIEYFMEQKEIASK